MLFRKKFQAKETAVKPDLIFKYKQDIKEINRDLLKKHCLFDYRPAMSKPTRKSNNSD